MKRTEHGLSEETRDLPAGGHLFLSHHLTILIPLSLFPLTAEACLKGHYRPPHRCDPYLFADTPFKRRSTVLLLCRLPEGRRPKSGPEVTPTTRLASCESLHRYPGGQQLHPTYTLGPAAVRGWNVR